MVIYKGFEKMKNILLNNIISKSKRNMIIQSIIGSVMIIMVIYDAFYYKVVAVDIIFLILGIILLFFAYNNYKVLKNPNISPLFQQLDGSFKDKVNYLNKQLKNIIYEDKNEFKRRFMEVNGLNNKLKLTFDEIKRHNPNMSLDEVLYAVYDTLKDDYDKPFEEFRNMILEAK